MDEAGDVRMKSSMGYRLSLHEETALQHGSESSRDHREENP